MLSHRLAKVWRKSPPKAFYRVAELVQAHVELGVYAQPTVLASPDESDFLCMLNHARATYLKTNFLFVTASDGKSSKSSVEAQLEHQLGRFTKYTECDFLNDRNVVVVSNVKTTNLPSLYALCRACKKGEAQLVFTTVYPETARILRNVYDAKIYHDKTGTDMLSRDYVEFALKNSLRFNPARVHEVADMVLQANSEAVLDHLTAKTHDDEYIRAVTLEAQHCGHQMRDLLC